jgi:hypothetical protein
LEPGDVLLLDEFHELDEDSLALLAQHRGQVGVITATPGRQEGFTEIKLTESRVSQFQVSRVETRSTGLIEDQVVRTVREQPASSTIMVIVPSLKKCRTIVGALRIQCPGLRVSLVWKGDTSIKPSDVYVCTAVVDAGITIPGVDCVIDSGHSVGRRLGKLGTFPSSRAVSDQRAGRTGRTCNGTYIRLSTKYDEEKFDFSSAFAANHHALARHYGEKREFTPMEEAIPWLPGIYNDWVSLGDFGACFFWWRMLENQGDLAAVERDFTSARLNPKLETWGFVFKLFGEVNIPRYENVLARVHGWSSPRFGGNWICPTSGRVETLELPRPLEGLPSIRQCTSSTLWVAPCPVAAMA